MGIIDVLLGPLIDKMVNSCCVVGCTNRVGKAAGLRFFRFPTSDRARCARWVAAVRRSSWKPTDSSRICSAHFVNGESCILILLN